jgi:hypothetical protein
MFEHGIARAGYIEVPRDPDLAYEFLGVEWRTVQHYGIEIGRRRYNGHCLNPYRGLRSPYTGVRAGKWPIHTDPDDVTRVYFRDPTDRRWHTLWWEHAPAAAMPFSDDALQFARKLAATKYQFPDDRLAVADLLERWNLGLSTTLPERRMALRISREQATEDLPDSGEPVASLPSVRRILDAPEAHKPEPEPPAAAEHGDDDTVDLDDITGDGFYDDAWQDV